MKLDKAELYLTEKFFFTDEEAEPMRADALDTAIKAMKSWQDLRELVRTESFNFTKDF